MMHATAFMRQAQTATQQRFLQRATLSQARSQMFLGMGASRGFASVEPRIFSNAVFMADIYPARLTIPTSKDGESYDFTCDNNMTVADFRQRVLDSTDDDVSSFELLSADPEQKDIDKMRMGELKSQKFRMRVNQKLYDVYPDFVSISRQHAAVTKNKKEMSKLDDLDDSIPIFRQSILRDFYANLIVSVKKEAGTGGKISEEKLQKAFKNSIKLYAENLAANADSNNASTTLEQLREELAVQQEQRNQIMKQSHKKAGMMLGVGFLGSMAQLVGFTLGIYVIYDWNEMEPYTWIACKQPLTAPDLSFVLTVYVFGLLQRLFT